MPYQPWENIAVVDYWLRHYSGVAVCVLCGNSGRIDTTLTARSPSGALVGGVHPCICPNGQGLRAHAKDK